MKIAKNHSYDTMQLLHGDIEVMPCGFGTGGARRRLKKNTLLGKLKERCNQRGRPPKLAVCITMYNEEERELVDTITGVMQNYNALRDDLSCAFTRDDMVVALVADGLDKLTEPFKEFAREKQFFDEDLLRQKDFMKQDRSGAWVLKDLDELVTRDRPVPSNILHLF